MTVKEVITYLLDFNMESEVVFVDQKNKVNSITTDPHTYLGNGKVDHDVKQVKFISANCAKTKPKNEELTVKEFENCDYIQVVDEKSEIRGYVGTVISVSEYDGGNAMFTQPDTVTCMFREDNCGYKKSFAETLSIHSVVKISEEEYYATLRL